MSVFSLDPETGIIYQFLGPQTDVMGKRNFMLDSVASIELEGFRYYGRSVSHPKREMGCTRVNARFSL